MDSNQIAKIISSIETKEAEVRILKAQLFEATIADLESKHQQEIQAIEAKIAAVEAQSERDREAQSVENRTKEIETLTSLWQTGAEDSEISVNRENQLADLLGAPRRRIIWDPNFIAATRHSGGPGADAKEIEVHNPVSVTTPEGWSEGWNS